MYANNSGTIEIPLRDSDEVIELGIDQLPDGEEVLSILKQECCPLHVWIRLAIEYYKQNRVSEFVHILESSRTNANTSYRNHEKDMLKALDTLAAYYVQQANREKNKERKRDYCSRATVLYTSADRISMYDPEHLLSRAYFCLLESDKMDQANAQFDFVLNTDANNLPALIGKACISFNKKDYKGALNIFKKALRINPNAPASVRLGLGLCFYKLNKPVKARMAFERALDLEPDCVGSLVGLSILELNNKTNESTKRGVELLSRAYQKDKTNPIVLNHLANHFFYKKDYEKVHQLATHAFHNTETEAIKAETCYQLARSYHAQGHFDQAFQYYYQSTQFSAPNFILPYFGLAQMYLYKRDDENAATCFEKVLKAVPGNYEAMKILGSIYAGSKSFEKREVAKAHLKKVTELQPDDVEAWIELAQILEAGDVTGALHAYGIATKILTERIQEDIPPEILNNVASLHFRLGNYADCKRYYDAALKIIDTEASINVDNEAYFNGLRVTIKYNLGRLHEAIFEFDLAEGLYRDILLKHQNYTDCYLRLGCMCRDRGKIHDASDWFSFALAISKQHADVWSLIGNLHLSKDELGLAQKKFERILSNNAQDCYAQIALGNIWLATLYQLNRERDKDKIKRHEERALKLYTDVLKVDARNIWAANGVGCILARKGLLNEARDIFAQVREATADFSDVWLNIAHVLVEHKQYPRAIQMYENCIKKFFKSCNVEVMLYWARALFKANQLNECKALLIKARHVAPNDTVLMHNLAHVQLVLAKQTLQDNKYSLKMVRTAIADLETAKRTFQWLATCTMHDRSRFEIKYDFKLDGIEAKKCEDLLKQTEYHLSRAKRIDEDEREMKRRQQEEREETRLKMVEEQTKREQELLQQKMALQQQKMVMQAKRDEIMKRTQNMTASAMDDDKKSRKRGAKKDNADEYVSSGDEKSGGDEEGSNEAASIVKIKKKAAKKAKRAKTHEEDDFIDDNQSGSDEAEKRRSGKKKRVKRRMDDESGEERSADDGGDGADEDAVEERVRHKSKKKKKSHGKEREKKEKKKPAPSSSSKANSMFKSKEFVMSDDDDTDSDSNEAAPVKKSEKRKGILSDSESNEENEKEQQSQDDGEKSGESDNEKGNDDDDGEKQESENGEDEQDANDLHKDLFGDDDDEDD